MVAAVQALVPCAECRAQVAATVQAEGIAKAEEIYVADVDRKLKETFVRVERISKEALPRFQALALGQLVDQLLVLQSLERDKLGASAEEIEAEFNQYKKSLLDKDGLAANLRLQWHTEASFRRYRIAWEKSWKRHLGRTITPEAKQAYFDKHRRELDGTELRVGHILFKPADPAVPADFDELTRKARQVRQQIADGKVSFEDAVVAHSGGTKKDGGDLGFVQRHKSMPEPFARAAFELAKGEISQPVASTFGVHLIRCTDERAGKLTLDSDEVQEAVKLRLSQQIFEEVAARERKKALANGSKPGIQFTGQAPHFKPGTEELVLP
jgi:parvulin-like peptidyl-prolyl isomerase